MAVTGIEQRVEILLRDIRQKSGHREYSYNSGIPQRELVEYLNDAQDRLYNLILQEHPTLYRKVGTAITVTSGTSSYTLPTDGFLSHNITKVEFSPSGNTQDYTRLDQRSSAEENHYQGYPDSYFLRDGSIILSPVPNISGGLLRLEYQYVIPTLALRFGAAITSYARSAGVYHEFTWTANPITEMVDDANNGMVDYFSVVSATGAILYSGLSFISYNSTTFKLRVTDTGAALTGIPGSYIVFGTNASSHSSLPQLAKRYLVEYAVIRAQARDSNALEASLNSPLMQAMERDILDAFAHLEEDVFAVPILDYQFLGTDEQEF